MHDSQINNYEEAKIKYKNKFQIYHLNVFIFNMEQQFLGFYDDLSKY